MKGYKKVTKETYMQGLDKKPIPIIQETVKKVAITCQTCDHRKVLQSQEPCHSCTDYENWK